MQSIVLDDPKFWKVINFCMKCVLPLVKVLRLVEGEAKSAMEYIYEVMDGERINCKKIREKEE